MSFHAVEENPLAGVQAAADNGKKDARRKALSSLRGGCSSRVREQQLGSARTAQFFRWDGPSPSSRGLSTPGGPPCSTRRSPASKWMSNGLYQKGRFIVEICTLRAVDIDVRRSPVVVDGNRGYAPPQSDTPSGWAAVRGAGRLCPAAPRSSLMHCPCLRRGRRQQGSNAAYPRGVPWSGRGCHQHHGAANLRAPAYLYCDGTHAVLPFTRDRLRVVNVALG